MPTTRRHGVTTEWSEIWRSGRLVTRTRSECARVTLTEYWSFPASRIGMLKLGEISQGTGVLPYRATRCMIDGFQKRKFSSEQMAEQWIALSDRWGDRRQLEPEEDSGTAPDINSSNDDEVIFFAVAGRAC